MSDTTNVWFLLIDQEYKPIGTATKVTVPLTLDVDDLRTRIKEKEEKDLAHVDARNLSIYQCTDQSIDLFDDDDDDAGDKGMKKLETVFSTKKVKRLGVRRTIASLQLRRQQDILIVQVSDALQRVRKRDEDDPPLKRLKMKLLAEAPSYIAATKRFRDVTGPEDPVDCNRPFSLDMLPIELYDEAFGVFKTRRDQPPSKKALTFLDDLAHVTCCWYGDETSRRDAVQEVFQKHTNFSFDPKPIKGANYTTNGHLDVIVMPAAIRECKNETGDALNQVIAYYGHLLYNANHTPRHYGNLNTRFPCMLVVDQGTNFGFYGAIWDGRVRVEALMNFDLTTRHMNKKDRFAIASALDAFKEAVDHIQAHYHKITEDANAETAANRDRVVANKSRKFPYITSFEIQGEKLACAYRSRLASKVNLIFSIAANDNRESGEHIVKFTQQYSVEAHRWLASHGSAPQLWQRKNIPGDWNVVVMEYSSYSLLHGLKLSEKERKKVQSKVTMALKEFHDEGFVHGDVRKTNIFVDRQSLASTNAKDVKIHIIDFDWAGRVGEAKYPIGINTETIKRPDGVGDGVIITREHDEWMVRHLFP